MVTIFFFLKSGKKTLHAFKSEKLSENHKFALNDTQNMRVSTQMGHQLFTGDEFSYRLNRINGEFPESLAIN